MGDPVLPALDIPYILIDGAARLESVHRLIQGQGLADFKEPVISISPPHGRKGDRRGVAVDFERVQVCRPRIGGVVRSRNLSQ